MKNKLSKLKRSDNRYVKVYLSFLKIEIPSIIQISTLATVLSILTNNFFLRILIGVLVTLLLQLYLNEKLFVFLNNERRFYIGHEESVINKSMIITSLLRFGNITNIFFGCLVGIIVIILPPQLDSTFLCDILKSININFPCK